MIKCTKSCINWKNIKSNIISLLKLYPIIWISLKSIYNNSFMQVILLIAFGIWLLRYGELNSNQTMQTVAITLITASVFKFLLSANAFVTLISKVVRESFVDMEFLKHFKSDKLLSTTDTLVTETCKRKYAKINETLSSHIMNILNSDNGYYSSISILLEDKLEDNKIFTTCTYKLTTHIDKKELMPNGYKFSIDDNDFKIIKIILNDDDITEKVQEKLKIIDSKDFEYNIELEKGKNILTIIETYYDTDFSHGIFFNKISSNVEVRYKHCSNIINPTITTRYGEVKESFTKDGELYRDYGDKIFVENEFLFIRFNKKEV